MSDKEAVQFEHFWRARIATEVAEYCLLEQWVSVDLVIAIIQKGTRR